MTKARRRAKYVRAVILCAGFLYVIAALLWIIWPLSDVDTEPPVSGLLGTPLSWTPGSKELLPETKTIYTVQIATVVGALLLAQWAFLRPGRGFTLRLAARGRPLRRSVIAAAAMAMLLTAGAVATILELAGIWRPFVQDGGGTTAFTVWGAMLVVWTAWAWVFWVYWRQGDRYTQLGKILRALVAGSLLEGVVAVPVHVWAARQEKCYCLKGTYTTLVFAGTVLLWAFGPGIVLLYMHDRYRVARVLEPCARCGYSVRGNTSGICPECGTRIEPGWDDGRDKVVSMGGVKPGQRKEQA